MFCLQQWQASAAASRSFKREMGMQQRRDCCSNEEEVRIRRRRGLHTCIEEEF
jgi:hypothetical protein